MGTTEAMKLVQAQSTRPAFHDCEPSLLPSLAGFKRLRPLAPRTANAVAKNVTNKHVWQVQWKPSCSQLPIAGSNPNQTPQYYLEGQPQPQQQGGGGGTRWNPTPEQIEALEALYRGGMRTPNARQIQQITAELGGYGKIEGKNVFYWFQNHKARERQKQKRHALALALAAGGSSSASSSASHPRGVRRDHSVDGSSCKRRCRSWSAGLEELDEHRRSGATAPSGGGGGDESKTLELFPLHPEGR